MKVLLVSPKDPKTPSNLKFLMGGENTYTNSLLSYPPDGVHYTHHTEALKRGEVEYTYWKQVLPWLIKSRLLPLDAGYQCLKLKKKFDLIHCHGYSLKLDGRIRPPVVLGNSSSNFLFLRDYLGWSLFRIRIQYALRRYIHAKLDVYDPELYINQASKLVVFSEFAKKVHIDIGGDTDKIIVIPPGLPTRANILQKPHSARREKINILFAGVWFERKGGLVLLDAYRLLKKNHPYINITLLGPLPRGVVLKDRDIIHYDFVSYDKLCNEFYPTADIFVLVPPKAEGFGMVVLEAASFGIPSVVTSVYALPEIVEDGKTGFVIKPGSVEELVLALEKLITDKTLRDKMGKAARQRFIEKYWIKETNKKLLKAYQDALKSQNLKVYRS